MHLALAVPAVFPVSVSSETLLFSVDADVFRFSPFSWEQARPSSAPRKRRVVWGRGQGEPAIPLLSVVFPVRKERVVQVSTTGIDLAVRGHEVRKLFYAAFARGLVKDGYDPEEALQEVYRGLLARNAGTCPFDVTKSSFGHYVHIVTRCILANYIRKEKRRLQFESCESSLSTGSERFSVDSCADLSSGKVPELGALQALSTQLGGGAQIEECLRLLAAGHSRKEVTGLVGVESRWLDSLLSQAKGLLQAQ